MQSKPKNYVDLTIVGVLFLVLSLICIQPVIFSVILWKTAPSRLPVHRLLYSLFGDNYAVLAEVLSNIIYLLMSVLIGLSLVLRWRSASYIVFFSFFGYILISYAAEPSKYSTGDLLGAGIFSFIVILWVKRVYEATHSDTSNA